MPTNKNAILRYQTLDKCLSQRTKRYYIDDLVEACSAALYDAYQTKVEKRQVYADLNFIESPDGFGMEIEKIRDGHKIYFRYKDCNASIKNQPLKQDELDLIHNALTLLQRFEGIPQFEGLADLEKKLYTTSKLGENADSVVSFQHNQYLKGMDQYYKPIFNAIVNKRVIEIKYHPFGKDARKITVTPYHLKQYNNRWFLIGKQQESEYLSNYAIDRIESVKETSKRYEASPEKIDFKDYFSDVVGVSIPRGAKAEKVVLKVKDKAIGYIKTKPIHESQSKQIQDLGDGYSKVTLKQVINNYELRSVLRSFGEQVEVLAPASLRQQMKESAENVYKMYNDQEEKINEQLLKIYQATEIDKELKINGIIYFTLAQFKIKSYLCIIKSKEI